MNHTQFRSLGRLLALLLLSAAPVPAEGPVVGADPAVCLPPSTKVKLVLHGVEFQSKTVSIQPDAAPVLDEAAQLLADEDRPIAITEERREQVGSDALSSALARRRARAVKQYLVVHGIAANRVVLDHPSESDADITGAALRPTHPVEVRVD